MVAEHTLAEKPATETFTFAGRALETGPEALGALRRSDDAAGDWAELRRRMDADGYLFLPGLLRRSEVVEARRRVAGKLQAAGLLLEGSRPEACLAAPDAGINFMPEAAKDNPELMRVLYDGPMMEFYRGFLGGAVRHFDYTWFRAKAPGGNGTRPHYDVVYMGRGTRRLYTSWTPLSDMGLDMGGLMLLEGSHRQEELVATYGQTDVDRYCENDEKTRTLLETARNEGRNLTGEERGRARWQWPGFGSYSEDAAATRRALGGRWLTAEYRMGDLLVFGMYTLHASSDNHTRQIRLSSDSRYQLASEAVDERWIGADPPAHGIRAHLGMIC